jgi:hypothetical protein
MEMRERIVRTPVGFAGALLLLSAAAGAQPSIPAGAQAGDPIMARLSAEKAGALEPGLYSAGEGRQFTLTPYRGKYLLRFADGAENFVLTADPGSMGAKLLKYDTGAAALSVSVWGGVTLYAADAPGGLPATYQGAHESEAQAPAPAAISAAGLKSALEDEASHFSYADNLGLRFTLDSAGFSDADGRAMAFDALAAIQAGIERFVTAPGARQTLARRVNLVKLEKGKPGMALAARTLVVRFAPAQGFLGRLSSHAVAHQLGKLLSVNTAE